MAQLLRRFEAYFSNVARNLRRTYLKPFVIVTANMSKGRAPRGGGVRSAGRTPARSECAAPARPSLREGSTALASGSLSIK